MLLVLVEGVRNRGRSIPRLPLLGAGRALRELPFELEQVVEEVVAPLRRGPGPRDFRTSGDGVGAEPRAVPALPAETLILFGAWPSESELTERVIADRVSQSWPTESELAE